MPDVDAAPHHRIIRRGLALVGGYARAHPLTFGVSVAGSVAMALASVGFTVVLGQLTDEVVLPAFEPGVESENTAAIFTALIVVALIRSGGVVARRFFAGLTVYRLRNDFQRELADHYVELPYRTIQSLPRGRLVAHADSDVDQATDAVSPLPFTVGVVTILVVGLVSMWLVDPYLMLVVLGVAPILAVLSRLQTRLSAGPALDVRKGLSDTASVAAESFDGAVIVKTLGRAEAELERFSAEAAILRDHQIRLAKIRAVFAALVGVLPDLAAVVLVLVGAWQVGEGNITTGELVQAVALFGVLAFPIHVIGYFLGDLAPAVVARDRLDAILTLPRVDSSPGRPLPAGALGVEVRGLALDLDDTPVLDGIDFEVAPEEVVALVGPTGAGKSSLLHAVAGLLPPQAGTIRIGGLDEEAIDRGSRAHRVAVAFQEPYLLGDTVAANIAYGVDLDAVTMTDAADIARMAETIAHLPDGYDTVLGERGVTFSGGQRQRLAMARAIARAPGLLLLDDATSAVDPVIEEEILDGLRSMRTTMVVVAHRRSTVALADRVVFMNEGRILAEGTHEQLLEEMPAYQALLRAYDVPEVVL